MEHSNTQNNLDAFDTSPDTTADDFESQNSMIPSEKLENKIQREIEEIIKTTPNEADQIDAIAEKQNWFRPDPDNYPTYATVKAYMAGTLDLAAAVEKLAEPIDQAYSTADHGQAIRKAENVAANQRQYHSAEDAREQWGEPLPADEVPAEDDTQPTTEGLLWELWYTVLHVAKQTPWQEDAGAGATQEKLVDLVRALKARPGPPAPAKMTKALQNDWIWTSGTLWSELIMLGPSTRECWNDGPGCGSGFSVPEIHAWANINAFIARLTRADLAEFWIYAIWAIRDALEVEHKDYEPAHKSEKAAKLLDAYVPAAAVWIIVMGKELWEKDEDLTPKNPNQGDPARGGALWKGKSAFCKGRWDLWATRFEALSGMEDLITETREIAAKTFTRMEEIKRTAAS